MPDEQKKRQEPDEERDAKVPPTGAKTDSAVEPEDDYDLDIGEDEDEDGEE